MGIFAEKNDQNLQFLIPNLKLSTISWSTICNPQSTKKSCKETDNDKQPVIKERKFSPPYQKTKIYSCLSEISSFLLTYRDFTLSPLLQKFQILLVFSLLYQIFLCFTKIKNFPLFYRNFNFLLHQIFL